MNDKSHQAGSAPPRWRPRVLWRAVRTFAALVAVGTLVAACGGGSSSPGVASAKSSTSRTASGSSNSGAYKEELAYAICVRSHGEANFPDPSPTGGFKITSGSDDPQLRAAEQACADLAPGGGQNQTAGGSFTARQVAQVLAYAQCMRRHGILNFPDPTSKGMGSLNGIDMNSPQFAKASQACQTLLPNSGGSGPVTRPGS
jgi:hypothetical protein